MKTNVYLQSIFLVFTLLFSDIVLAEFKVTCFSINNSIIFEEIVEKKNPIISYGYNWVKINKDNSIHLKIKNPKDKSKLLNEMTCPSGNWKIEVV